MIDDELLAKFDRIQDLPVSEEIIGAYLEGSTDFSESFVIEQEALLHTDLDFLLHQQFADTDSVPLLMPEVEIDDLLTKESENMQKLSSEYDDLSDLKIFGEEGTESGTYHPLVNQFYPDTCAIRSQQIILRDYGIDISQESLVDIASDHGWYAPGQGTPMECIGNLLNVAGVECHQSYNNTVFDLANELSQGHRIIVGVDSGELWAQNIWDRMSEKLEDFAGFNSGADHALIVAGVEVNPYDPSDVKVVLTDPGSGNLRIEYSLDEFMDAWQDSNCFMVSTSDPAPYQFDPQTNTEIPSGFNSNFAYNGFVIDNGYELSADNFTMPELFAATYSEENSIEFPLIDNPNENEDIDFNDFDLTV